MGKPTVAQPVATPTFREQLAHEIAMGADFVNCEELLKHPAKAAVMACRLTRALQLAAIAFQDESITDDDLRLVATLADGANMAAEATLEYLRRISGVQGEAVAS